MKLLDSEKREILKLIEADKLLPDKYRFLLFDDNREVELIWNGKTNEVSNIVLPFQVIELVDEPRAEKPEDTEAQMNLFDTRGRQQKGWTNKLIWGDNKLILSSLKNGPLREEIEAQGGIKLIYIDPPFDVGADFSMDIEIGDETFTKKPNVLEELAYRDTWGKGQDSFLSMIYERIQLIRDLLSPDGHFIIHCDQRLNAALRYVLIDAFGIDNFRNEIIWQRTSAGKTVSANLPKNCDYLLWCTKSKNYKYKGFRGELTKENIKVFSKDDGDGRGLYRTQPVIKTGNPGPMTTYDYVDNTGKVWKCPKKGWRFNKNRMKELENDNRLIFTTVISEKYYLDERLEIGRQLSNLWADISGNTVGFSNESQSYPTQKPEKLLSRIIESLTDEKDLVADFFAGSGTTAAVAEKMNRKWICADLGKFAIHTTRKRLINIQRTLKESGKDYRAFEILNLGKYERAHYIGINPNLREEEKRQQLEQKEKDFINLILHAFRAEPVGNFKCFHGKKAGRMTSVGPINLPVTRLFVEEIILECRQKRISRVDVLAFEFEMGLFPNIQEEAKAKGIDLAMKYIPREVFDKRAVEKNQVVFHDVSYIEVKPHIKKGTIAVELTDFSVYYSQDSVNNAAESLKNGKNKIVVEQGQIIKVSKDKNGIVTKDILTKKWTDWIDYWAVDFNFESKREIIRVQKDPTGGIGAPAQTTIEGMEDEQIRLGEWEEQWTGEYIFENEWQSFRTKSDRSLELKTPFHECEKGRYKIAVKVVDIFGNDTMKIIEVSV